VQYKKKLTTNHISSHNRGGKCTHTHSSKSVVGTTVRSHWTFGGRSGRMSAQQHTIPSSAWTKKQTHCRLFYCPLPTCLHFECVCGRRWTGMQFVSLAGSREDGPSHVGRSKQTKIEMQQLTLRSFFFLLYFGTNATLVCLSQTLVQLLWCTPLPQERIYTSQQSVVLGRYLLRSRMISQCYSIHDAERRLWVPNPNPKWRTTWLVHMELIFGGKDTCVRV
jgi:hypothetical protein